jgi:hypothetical protein
MVAKMFVRQRKRNGASPKACGASFRSTVSCAGAVRFDPEVGRTIPELVNERHGISPEMAIRLARAFGSSAAVWAGLQLDYDMARAMEHADRIKVQRVPQPAAEAE